MEQEKEIKMTIDNIKELKKQNNKVITYDYEKIDLIDEALYFEKLLKSLLKN